MCLADEPAPITDVLKLVVEHGRCLTKESNVVGQCRHQCTICTCVRNCFIVVYDEGRSWWKGTRKQDGSILITLSHCNGLDLLRKSKPSRVVVVGSCGQVAGRLNTEDLSFGRYWFPLLNYCTTKQCNMLFTVELSRKLTGSGTPSLDRVDRYVQLMIICFHNFACIPGVSVKTDWAKEPFEPNWNKVSVATSSPRHEMQAQRERCAPEEAISNLPSPNTDSQGGFAVDSHPADIKLRKRQSSESGVTVNCCHPGFVRSEIAVRSSDIQTWLFNLLLNFYGKSVKEGAETTVYLAVSEEVENVSGKYFKDCAPTFAVPWATNAAAAKKLYEESIRMTQIKEVI
ncbi:uncharacterized protein [Dermacentor albipictus]|uniref:uncharacterized protein isoform X6 n=1 Tax=Dermacentor albipictus TaxID=60249 RepID=UPI0031FE00AF